MVLRSNVKEESEVGRGSYAEVLHCIQICPDPQYVGGGMFYRSGWKNPMHCMPFVQDLF